MATKIVILQSTLRDGRLIVAFSYPPLALLYKEYLEKSENLYNDGQDWRVDILGGQVSMNLPCDITFESSSGDEDAVLVFEDEAKAIKWEEKMILWEKCSNQEGRKRRISRSLTVGHLIEKLGLSDETFQFHRVPGSSQQIVGQFSDSLLRQFKGTRK